MATPTLFPGLITDIEDRILSHMCHQPYDLVALSGTCSRAYGKLSSGKYFMRLFAAQHPLLAKTDQVFLQLRTYYPDCCWKVACCSMLKDYTPFTMEFLQRPGLAIASAFLLEKEQLVAKKLTAELEVKRICSSYYQDPSSPIHQAWEMSVKDENEYDVFFLQNYDQIKNLLAPFDHSLKFKMANLQFSPYTDPEEVPHEEKIKLATLRIFEMLVHPICLDLFSQDLAVMEAHPLMQAFDLNRIEEYRKVIPILSEINQSQEETYRKKCESFSQYNELERSRLLGVKEVKKSTKQLAYLDKAEEWRVNQLNLLVDQYFARNAERFAGNALMLCRAAEMCTRFELDRSTREAIESSQWRRFSDCFNSYEENNLIWEMLYHQCANGVQEEQWAEKNCHNFSKELVDITLRLKALTIAFIPIYFESLDLKAYFQKNYDTIPELQLSNLRLLKRNLIAEKQMFFSESEDVFGTMDRPARSIETLSKPIVNLLFLANSAGKLLPTLSFLIDHKEDKFNLKENLSSTDTSA